jgi:hypothetical protein
MGFFEDRCGTSCPLPFALFFALFLGIAPGGGLSDERRALGVCRLRLTEVPILLGFILEEGVFRFLTFVGEILVERGRRGARRRIAVVFFVFGVLLNCIQPPDCCVVFQLRQALTKLDLQGPSGPVNFSYHNKSTTQRLLPF